MDEYEQSEGAVLPMMNELVQDSRPSVLVKLPIETRMTNETSAKRKRVEDAPAPRVTRPKLSDDRTGPGDHATTDGVDFVEHMPLSFSDEAHTPPLPTRKTQSKQKPVANRPIQQAATQAGPSYSEQPASPAKKPAAPVAETVKSRKTISKPKSKPVPARQQPPPAAAPGRSKKGPAAVKKEAGGPRQPAGACKSCRSRHQKCDRTHPACGRCTKLGSTCEYFQTSTVTAQSAAPSTSPQEQTQSPIKKSSKETGRASVRERSVTVSPEEPRQKSPAKRPLAVSPSKKPVVTAAPTAASSRAPRAKKTQTSRTSPQKK